MHRKLSLYPILLSALVLVTFRGYYSDITGKRELNITTWDALGYYIYLPAIFIYDDYTTYEWFPGIDEKYNVSGGWVYQLSDLPNGNKVGKYLGGVAIFQAPFFFIGHGIASVTDYPADGFSAPYQYALGFGCILWFLIGLLILRRVLLRYFDDRITALTLLFLVLATNVVQYVSVDNAMSHAYIFPLYAILLWATAKWHEKPGWTSALLIGLSIGWASISRPTELIMFVIPLLWGTGHKEASKKKWAMVRENWKHFYFLAAGGLIGVAPQLIYWKIVTGSFIYDVGSKWDFLTPHFQVLFGWKKGLFIYTPITILFIVGMFIRSTHPFRKSAVWFGLLNIYIIIAWHHWEYGASYAARALSQSYPLYALPLAVALERIWSFRKWRWFSRIAGGYFILLNLFQLWQYNETILHYNDMNRRYYSRIYWNPSPSPLDVSLMDTDEIFKPGKSSTRETVKMLPDTVEINPNDSDILFTYTRYNGPRKIWIHVKATFNTREGLWGSYMKMEARSGEKLKTRKFRLATPIAKENSPTNYEFYFRVPKDMYPGTVTLSIHANGHLKTELMEFEVERYTRE